MIMEVLNYQFANEEGSNIKGFLGGGAFVLIPSDPKNKEYQDFLKWCDDGNKPQPYVDQA